MEYSYELKIPKDRIAVLIGKHGEIKKKIEEETNSNLFVDSKDGDIRISGEDSLGLFTARDIVRAIGRGFSPEIALLILKSDYLFELLSIPEYAGKSKNSLARLKGRVIGADGKTRRYIEEKTETYISVYGKTIGIIGEAETVMLARKAVESLLQGSPHSSVYKWLEKKRREIERKRMTGLDRVALKDD